MKEEDFLQSLSKNTRKSYRTGLRKFEQYFGKSIDEILKLRERDLGSDDIHQKRRLEKEIEKFLSRSRLHLLFCLIQSVVTYNLVSLLPFKSRRQTCACPLAFTFRYTFFTIPFSSIKNVVRSVPINVLP